MACLPDPVDVLAEALAGIRDGDHRKDAFMRQACQFGVSHFAYVSSFQGRADFHLETNYAADWVTRYMERNYVLVDPVSLEGQRSLVPFRWQTALALPAHDRPQARQVFDEAAAYGLRDGFTVPVRTSDGLALMSMAVDNPALFKPGAAQERHALHLLAMHFHMACERALCPPPAPEPPAPPRLTPREREVLLWTAKGKTGWEIAQILRLAERTVVYHVENAKTKLKASSRSHAVVVALSLGLIDP